MFFLLSKTIGWFTYPLSLTLVGLLLFMIFHKSRQRLAWTCLWAAVLLLWFCSTQWGTDLLLKPLEHPYETPRLPEHADIIVILGGSLDLSRSEPGHLEYNPAADRFIYALKLAQRWPKTTLVFSGGTASLWDKTKTEASLLKAEAEAFGVAPERILVDDQSRNTHENAVQTKRVMQETPGATVVLVTSAFHMTRSLECFRKVGVQAIPYAVDFRSHSASPNRFGWLPEVSNLGDSTSAIKEYVGRLMYRAQGYI